MIQATSGRRFEEKAVKELSELEPDARYIYALVAVATAYRFGLTKDEILIASGDRSNTALNEIEKLVKRHLLVRAPTPDGELRVRHRMIGEILDVELRAVGQLQEPLRGLALIAAVKIDPSQRRGSRPWRLLRMVLNHEFLMRSLGLEGARNLYGFVEQTLGLVAHYWLQRGSLEVQFGDLALAENFLNQARGLSSEDPLVENEWAYLLLRKAVENPAAIDAPKWAEAAIVSLEDLIDRRGKVDPYPYHVLGSQGLAWARRGILDKYQRRRFLEKLMGRTEAGCKHHPRAEDLRKLHADLRKEYLETALT